MPKYTYSVVDGQGRPATGELEGPSQDQIAERLRGMGYFPTKIEPVAAGTRHPAAARRPRRFGGNKVRTKSLTAFTRQLSTLVDAGLPLLRSLEVLRKQEIDPALNRIILQIGESIESGGTFSEALAQHPKVFSPLYVNMVRAGEVGGVLHITLERLAQFQEKAAQTRNKVLAAMVYPCVVLTVATAVTLFLMTVIVPRFQEIFADLLDNGAMPWLTIQVIRVSHLLMHQSLLILAVVGGAVVAVKIFGRTRKGRYCLDQWKLKMPLMGSLIRKAGVARFARTLGTLIASGVPILQALSIVRETVGNAVMAAAVGRVHGAVKEGESIAGPLGVGRVFPALVVSMVEVGEQTGALPEMLAKVADVYDDEVDKAVSALTSVLEPIMIVLMAVIVGTIVIAMFLPLITIIIHMS
jgi:type IV pilus assembly protein PilC